MSKVSEGQIDFSSPETGELISRAFRRTIRQTYWKHKQLGAPIVVYEDGEVKKIQPENITIPDEIDESSNDSLMTDRMTNDYVVNAAIAYDLTDAREDLDRVIDLFEPNKVVDESEYRVLMAHIFYHLNCAWNQRKLTSEELKEVDSSGYRRLGRFPLDITPM